MEERMEEIRKMVIIGKEKKRKTGKELDNEKYGAFMSVRLYMQGKKGGW